MFIRPSAGSTIDLTQALEGVYNKRGGTSVSGGHSHMQMQYQ